MDGSDTVQRTTKSLYRSVAPSMSRTGSPTLILSRLPTRILLGLKSMRVSMPLTPQYHPRSSQLLRLLKQLTQLQPTSSLATLWEVLWLPLQEWISRRLLEWPLQWRCTPSVPREPATRPSATSCSSSSPHRATRGSLTTTTWCLIFLPVSSVSIMLEMRYGRRVQATILLLFSVPIQLGRLRTQLVLTPSSQLELMLTWDTLQWQSDLSAPLIRAT